MAGSWKRITFLYTTGHQLNQANVVNDLVVQATEREILWKKLRERAQYSIAYRADPNEVPEWDPALLELVFGLNKSIPEVNLEDY